MPQTFTTEVSCHVYMAPCRSSSLCSRCFLLSYRTENTNQPGTDAMLSGTNPTHSHTLTLSFLNSSYSGLSVGNSSRQSGQELVYDRKHAKDSKWILHRTFGLEWNSELRMCELYLAEPGQYTSWVEKVFARHFSNRLLFLELQQTHGTLETFVCENKKPH